MAILDAAIESVVRDSVERLIAEMVRQRVNAAYADSRLADFIVMEAKDLFRTDPELRTRLKAVLCEWIDKGCPPPVRR